MKWPNRSRSDGATAVGGDSEPEVQLRRASHPMRFEESKRRESFESETTEILDDDEESVHISMSPEPLPVVLNRERLMTPPSMGIHGGYVNSFVNDDSDAGTPRNAAELFAIAKSTSQKHTVELLAEFRSSQSKNAPSNRSSVATGDWVAIRTPLVIAPSNKRASESIRPVYPANRPEITYKGWDRGFNIKQFDEREMEAKHGSLQLTRRPWLDEYDTNARGYPWTDPPSDGTVAIYLYHPAFIYDRLPDERECEMYFIDLFFQYRFYAFKRAKISESTSSSVEKLLVGVYFQSSQLQNEARARTRQVFEEHIDRPRHEDPPAFNCLRIQLHGAEDLPLSIVLHRLYQAHHEINRRFNISLTKKNENQILSDSDKAELSRIERMLLKIQIENSELLASSRQTDIELRELREGHVKLFRENIKLQAQFQIAIDDVDDLRNRLAKRDCSTD